jgi:hypothetical protein
MSGHKKAVALTPKSSAQAFVENTISFISFFEIGFLRAVRLGAATMAAPAQSNSVETKDTYQPWP